MNSLDFIEPHSPGGHLLIFLANLLSTNTRLNLSIFLVVSQITSNYLGLNLPIITLNMIFSWICLPFGWLLGFEGAEAYVPAPVGARAENDFMRFSTRGLAE